MALLSEDEHHGSKAKSFPTKPRIVILRPKPDFDIRKQSKFEAKKANFHHFLAQKALSGNSATRLVGHFLLSEGFFCQRLRPKMAINTQVWLRPKPVTVLFYRENYSALLLSGTSADIIEKIVPFIKCLFS